MAFCDDASCKTHVENNIVKLAKAHGFITSSQPFVGNPHCNIVALKALRANHTLNMLGFVVESVHSPIEFGPAWNVSIFKF